MWHIFTASQICTHMQLGCTALRVGAVCEVRMDISKIYTSIFQIWHCSTNTKSAVDMVHCTVASIVVFPNQLFQSLQPKTQFMQCDLAAMSAMGLWPHLDTTYPFTAIMDACNSTASIHVQRLFIVTAGMMNTRWRRPNQVRNACRQFRIWQAFPMKQTDWNC